MRSHAARGAGAVLGVVGALLVAAPVAGHVGYTAEGGRDVDPLAFLVDVLADPVNLALLAGGGAAAVVAALAYLRYRPARRDVAVFRRAVSEYRDLLPWLLRLSFGLPLVGAGFAGYLFSPAVPPFLPVILAPSRLFQIGLGFLLLFGLATRVVALVGLLAYLLVALFHPQALLAAEYVPGFVAIALVGSGRPSADQVLQAVAAAEGTVYGRIDPVHRLTAWFDRRVDSYERYVPVVVRVGLGVVFLFLGVVEKLLAPGPALAVVDKYNLTQAVPVDPGLWVVGAGLTEVALGIALVLGLFIRAAAMLSLGTFVATLFALPDDPVLAHITLFGLASALVVTGAGPFSLDRRLADRPAPDRDLLPEDADLADD